MIPKKSYENDTWGILRENIVSVKFFSRYSMKYALRLDLQTKGLQQYAGRCHTSKFCVSCVPKVLCLCVPLCAC